MPPTGLELLGELVDQVRADMHVLIAYLEVIYDDPNAGSEVLLIGASKWRWGQLDPGAQVVIGRVRPRWTTLCELAAQAVRRSAPERGSAVDQVDELVLRVIGQRDDYYRGPPGRSTAEVADRVDQALDGLAEALAELPAARGAGGRLLVPDTNALLFKPDLESWTPPGTGWTVVLVPQVLRELDQKKMRDDTAGQKAASVIRRIKEYARRGDTFESVPITKALRLREVAVDSDMGDTLSWLRAGHGDDELLASVLDLRCDDLNAAVVLATRDRNLQNKARMACCSCLDVEDEL